MTTLFVLDVEEFEPLARVASDDPHLTVGKCGPYFQITSPDTITIDRRATGCRHAVWYSAIGGISGGTLLQHDKDVLRIGPA